MNDTIGGSYPGGPRREKHRVPMDRAPRLESVEDFEERRGIWNVRRMKGARRRRVLYGALGVLLLAGVVGYGLGTLSHRSPDEINAASAAPSAGSELSREVNRTLLELWRMEDVEQMRNSGRIR